MTDYLIGMEHEEYYEQTNPPYEEINNPYKAQIRMLEKQIELLTKQVELLKNTKKIVYIFKNDEIETIYENECACNEPQAT